MLLSIIIPCHNEAENIPLVLERFGKLYRQSPNFELLVVDNASTDDTPAVLKTISAKPEFSFVQVLGEPIPGYGRAILSGLQVAKGRVLSWTHADLQTDPADLLGTLKLWSALPDRDRVVVKGKRINRQPGPWLFTAGMSLIASIVLGGIFWDVNAQPKLFPRKLFERDMKDPPGDFSLDLYLLAVARKNKYRLVAHPVAFQPRLHGSSKWASSFRSRWKTVWRTLKYIVRLRRHLSEPR